MLTTIINDEKMIGKVTKFSSDEEKHTGDATCLLFLNGYLYSGGADGKIKVCFSSIN